MMVWGEIFLWTCVGLGAFAGAYLAVRSISHPVFWIDLTTAVIRKVGPIIWYHLSMRMSPEDEAKWRREQLTKPNPRSMPSKFPKRDR